MNGAMVLPITVSPDGADFIAGWEDCRLIAYQDGGGVWTCGFGQTGQDICAGTFWTQEYADQRFSESLRKVVLGLRTYLHREATQQQFDALCSLAFNCGVMAIGNSGLMARFNSGLDEECAIRFLLWNKDNGKIVDGLTKRRTAEMHLFATGDYSGRP